MNIIKVREIPITDTPHKVEVRKLYDKTSAQAMHITLKPGESLKPHIPPVDVFFYILEGPVDVRVGNETISVQKDCLVESPKNILHYLSNSSLLPVKILVVKAPKPETQTKVL